LHRIRAVCVLALTAGIVLAAPGRALAHGKAVVVALDYSARVLASGSGIHASILDGDLKLRLAVDPGRTVDVLGYGGEPFLRFSSRGVQVNRGSLTAWSDGLANPGNTGWRRVTSSGTFAWHEHRLAPVGGRLTHWTVPILVDGRPQPILGETVRAKRPALWPWLAVAAVFLVGTAVLVRARKAVVAAAVAIGLPLIASAAGLASVVAVTLAHGVGNPGLEIASDCVLAAIGLVALAVFPKARPVAAVCLGLLAAFEGAGLLGMFDHGVIVSELPPSAARAAAAIAFDGGLAAALIAGARLWR
jgi:hypothetical protein